VRIVSVHGKLGKEAIKKNGRRILMGNGGCFEE
jgi:hypothetical protein